MSKIIIYSKDNCQYCVKAKTLLNIKKMQFEEVVIGRDIDKDEFVAIYPEVRTVPYILIDGNPIGGFDNLTEWVHENGPHFLTE